MLTSLPDRLWRRPRLRLVVAAAAAAGLAILVGFTATAGGPDAGGATAGVAATVAAPVTGPSTGTAETGTAETGTAETGTAETGTAGTPPTGRLRLGQLSPSTPAVDVYLGGPGRADILIFREVEYGTLTGHVAVPAGRWRVALRSAGSPAANAAPFTVEVDVAAGRDGSLLLSDTGPGEALRGRVIVDGTAAEGGSGLVRVVHGVPDGGPVDVTVVGGPVLADAIDYGGSTDQVAVDAGDPTVRLETSAGRRSITVDIADGSATTILLTRDEAGELAVAAVPTVPEEPDGPGDG